MKISQNFRKNVCQSALGKSQIFQIKSNPNLFTETANQIKSQKVFISTNQIQSNQGPLVLWLNQIKSNLTLFKSNQIKSHSDKLPSETSSSLVRQGIPVALSDNLAW